jgi:hypothetical protein
MSATARFYTVFVCAIALIVGVSFYAGYRTGFHAGAHVVKTPHRATVSRPTP